MRKRLHFPVWWGIYTPKSWLLVRCYPYEIDFANRILKPGDASFIQPACDVLLQTQRVVAVCPEALCSGEAEPVPTCPAVRRGAAPARAAARIFSAAFSSRSSTSPQAGHTWVRIDRVFLTRNPQGDAILRGEPRRDG